MTSEGSEQKRASKALEDGTRVELSVSGPEAARYDIDAALTAAVNKLALKRLGRDTQPSGSPPGSHGIVGKSPGMQALFRMIDKVAPTQCTVLITGENGTGKELVARAIHAGSPRAQKPFVAANCSAFNDNLLESELFGHKKGSFTGAQADKRGLFEEADGGTFLLDEVGDMSPALQAKLLRVLQEGTLLPVGGTQTKKVDVRIIAATNRDLANMVKQGTFREDLYYRLNVVALKTLPLRERGEDLDFLIDAFLRRAEKRVGLPKALAPETRAQLRAHLWPGNVRELQNEIERLTVLSGDDAVIGPEHLSRNVLAAKLEGPRTSLRSPDSSLEAEAEAEVDEPLATAVERFERGLIERTLARHQGNRTRVAEALGMSRRNLIRKLAALGLSDSGDHEP